MKKIRYFLKIFVCFVTLPSCQKSNTPGGAAALNIIDAGINLPTLYISFADTAGNYYLNQAQISYGSSIEYGNPAGILPLTLIAVNDTLKPAWRSTLNLKVGGIYSLYLSGLGGVPDTLFLRDTIPTYSDSSVGARFINLSSGGGPISVNFQGNYPNQNEFSDLGYQQITPFKTYSGLSSVGGAYNFEIRDQASGNLLCTFQWNFTIFKNNTLVICGSEAQNSSTPISVFAVNNF
jgi:hypothetical protein